MPKRTLSGVVTNSSCNKTVLVKVQRTYLHPLYKKIVKMSKNYNAHDENNKCSIGDKVKIRENKPISKTKSWVVISE